jgi:membrane protein implicated in regulation of membrane protease activity
MLPLSLSMLSLLALRPSEFVIAEIVCSALFFIPVGAGLGYLVGTVAAGVFLVMDVLERWWMRRWRGRTGGERAAQDTRPGDKPSD